MPPFHTFTVIACINWNEILFTVHVGKPIVAVGTPEAAAKMFRAEGKYPSRGAAEDKMTWILEKNNIPNNMGFT